MVLPTWTLTAQGFLLIYELWYFLGHRLNLGWLSEMGTNDQNPTNFIFLFSQVSSGFLLTLVQVFPQQICLSLLCRDGASMLSQRAILCHIILSVQFQLSNLYQPFKSLLFNALEKTGKNVSQAFFFVYINYRF